MWHYKIKTPLGPYIISIAKINSKPILKQAHLNPPNLLPFMNAPNPSNTKNTSIGTDLCHGWLQSTQKQQKPPQSVQQLADQVRKQIHEYFERRRLIFNLPLLLPAPTSWQSEVRQALLDIPYGQTKIYSQIATQLGSPRAARAVGQACARNAFHIIVPCHRVVSRGHQRHGYAGGGAHIKLQLIKFESLK